MKFRLIAPLLAVAAMLGACSSPAPVPEPKEPVAQGNEPVAEAKKAPFESQPLKYLVGRNLKPMPDKPLEVKTRCSFRDVAGGRGSLDLHVSKAEVKKFAAEISIPRQGLCRFNMRDFTQTGRLPNVVLADPGSECTVRMWEQGKDVTVAFHACQAKCDGDAFSYLWPILVNGKSGRCS